ncbi:hypothetical protein [Bradyrhizobium sp. AUGA SZCCT0042]|uniref:hypothetical protein n=1 Tax=Bradyrhizobium sp. AUGA SZCCT0042 TaxID=2807651 RepID=UPI001BA66D5A|nr:hypothetical protein [Bradyrhizobium sp. AUGA SZCCT0042]MBR1300645.1 hypothetical protein [Bradyrhizobium sp. AUGA SZCCT0042]
MIYTDTNDQCCEIARSFLQKHHLWMKDILQEYERKGGKEHLASDDAIEEPDPSACTDFVSLMTVSPRVSALAFTSKKAAIWTMQRLSNQDVLQRDQTNELIRRVNDQKERGEFWNGSILGRDMKFMLLPSPSGGVPLGCGRSAVQKAVILSSRDRLLTDRHSTSTARMSVSMTHSPSSTHPGSNG